MLSRCSISLMLAKTKAIPKKEAFLANFGHFCWRQVKIGQFWMKHFNMVRCSTGDQRCVQSSLRRAQISRVTKVSYSTSRRYEWRSSDSVLGYFISKITLQQRKMFKFFNFWWLAPKNSENHFFKQKSVKNQELDVKYWFGVSMWLSKKNYKII